MSTEEIIEAAYRRMEDALAPSPAATADLHRRVARRRQNWMVLGAGASVLAVAGVALIVGAAIDQDVATKNDQQPSFATAAPSTPDLESEFDWQTAIGNYKDELVRAAERHERFAGAEIRFAERAIILRGTGEPPADLVELMAQAPAGTVARWVTVPYTTAQLQQAGRDLMRALPRAVEFTLSSEYDGITVGIHRLPQTQAGMEDLRALAQDTTDVPVTFTEGQFGASGVFRPK